MEYLLLIYGDERAAEEYAKNATPEEQCVDINLMGTWFADDDRMLRDGVGVSITP